MVSSWSKDRRSSSTMILDRIRVMSLTMAITDEHGVSGLRGGGDDDHGTMGRGQSVLDRFNQRIDHAITHEGASKMADTSTTVASTPASSQLYASSSSCDSLERARQTPLPLYDDNALQGRENICEVMDAVHGNLYVGKTQWYIMGGLGGDMAKAKPIGPFSEQAVAKLCAQQDVRPHQLLSCGGYWQAAADTPAFAHIFAQEERDQRLTAALKTSMWRLHIGATRVQSFLRGAADRRRFRGIRAAVTCVQRWTRRLWMPAPMRMLRMVAIMFATTEPSHDEHAASMPHEAGPHHGRGATHDAGPRHYEGRMHHVQAPLKPPAAMPPLPAVAISFAATDHTHGEHVATAPHDDGPHHGRGGAHLRPRHHFVWDRDAEAAATGMRHCVQAPLRPPAVMPALPTMRPSERAPLHCHTELVEDVPGQPDPVPGEGDDGVHVATWSMLVELTLPPPVQALPAVHSGRTSMHERQRGEHAESVPRRTVNDVIHDALLAAHGAEATNTDDPSSTSHHAVQVANVLPPPVPVLPTILPGSASEHKHKHSDVVERRPLRPTPDVSYNKPMLVGEHDAAGEGAASHQTVAMRVTNVSPPPVPALPAHQPGRASEHEHKHGEVVERVPARPTIDDVDLSAGGGESPSSSLSNQVERALPSPVQALPAHRPNPASEHEHKHGELGEGVPSPAAVDVVVCEDRTDTVPPMAMHAENRLPPTVQALPVHRPETSTEYEHKHGELGESVPSPASKDIIRGDADGSEGGYDAVHSSSSRNTSDSPVPSRPQVGVAAVELYGELEGSSTAIADLNVDAEETASWKDAAGMHGGSCSRISIERLSDGSEVTWVSTP